MPLGHVKGCSDAPGRSLPVSPAAQSNRAARRGARCAQGRRALAARPEVRGVGGCKVVDGAREEVCDCSRLAPVGAPREEGVRLRRSAPASGAPRGAAASGDAPRPPRRVCAGRLGGWARRAAGGGRLREVCGEWVWPRNAGRPCKRAGGQGRVAPPRLDLPRPMHERGQCSRARWGGRLSVPRPGPGRCGFTGPGPRWSPPPLPYRSRYCSLLP